MNRSFASFFTLLVAAALAFGTGCGDEDDAPADTSGLRTLLAEQAVVVLSGEGVPPTTVDEPTGKAIRELAAACRPTDGLAEVVVDYPHDESIFPPEIVAPTFLWHDDAAGVDAWLVDVAFADSSKHLQAIVRGDPPTQGEIDRECLSPTNEIHPLTDYEASARTWTPSPELWEEIKQRSVESPAVCTFFGFPTDAPTGPLSQGQVRITTSKDPVGAPVFYRDVPLMPAKGKQGKIQPLGKGALPLICWRLRDISKPESRIVLTGMPTCANCHSFSLDGKTLGMDVDGPDGDKGAYMISPITKHMVVDSEQVITWNSFPDKPEGHKTIGFLSRISPHGKYALTTLNEALYVANFTDYKFLQVFYPTRGILAWYSLDTGKIKALPGADDERYVHTNGVWTPDGREIVFSRAEAFEPYLPDGKMADYANDPNEPNIRYDLYRMPFNNGKGGTPVIIEGASNNGASNTFPKVSPDGKWIVFTKCDNGQLMRPDGKLWIVPLEGGEAREMRCNTSRMNSWHSFSPNGRWMVFSSKENTPYTQMFLTHIDEDGEDSPRILVPNATAANRAVNIPEFMNAQYEDLLQIEIPAVNHHRFVQQGLAHMKAGRLREAVPALEKALEHDPTFGRAHGVLAHVYDRLGEKEKAFVHYERALETRADDALAHTGIATLLEQMGRTDEAILHLRQAVEADPHLFIAQNNLGLAMLRQGRADEAILRFRSALQIDVRSAEVHRNLSFVLLQQGEAKEAVAHMRDVIHLEPDDMKTRTLLAWQLATNPDAAIRDGEQAVTLAEEACRQTEYRRPEPLDALAAAYAETGRYAKAVETAARAVALARQRTPALAAEIQRRLTLYESKKPYHSR